MNHQAVTEIESYLEHRDYRLAVRRILDLSLDTDDPPVISKAIELSRAYHKETESSGNNLLPDTIPMSARSLLKEITAKNISYPAHEVLLQAELIAKTYPAGGFSLKPTSVSVSTGDILGVVGENGNGKTTLLRCIAGQLAVDKGHISYSRIHNPGYYDVKSYVAFIPQRIPKWYGRLKDNLHFSASIAGVKGEENERMVDFMIERLGLGRFAELTWNQISSGYRTRFEIARVLLQKPSLLILDEPLANLDINAQQTILTDLRFMTKSASRPMGVILSSQQLHEVEKTADNVLFIKNGACLYQTKEAGEEKEKRTVLEIETKADRSSIAGIIGAGFEIKFNGGFYTISSAQQSSAEIVGKLLEKGINISYFRDITQSTKRFFN